MDNIKLEKSWLYELGQEFSEDYMLGIKDFLKKEIENWKKIYPNPKNLFNALNHTPLDRVKVVIIGQDPYHWYWQAHGLSFSVQDWVPPPPSLKNIYKEIEGSLWIKKDFKNWNLIPWAKSWVLLLNSILSVEANKPASHSNIWWENFTDKIIKIVNDKKQSVVFLLWWAFAQKKKMFIDTNKHYVLETTHPSPFSAHRWFLGSKCFSKTNEILESLWEDKINW